MDLSTGVVTGEPLRPGWYFQEFVVTETSTRIQHGSDVRQHNDIECI